VNFATLHYRRFDLSAPYATGTAEASIADIAQQWDLKPSALTTQATEARSVVELSGSSVPAKPVIRTAQSDIRPFSWSK